MNLNKSTIETQPKKQDDKRSLDKSVDESLQTSQNLRKSIDTEDIKVVNPTSTDNTLEIEDGDQGTRLITIGDTKLTLKRKDPYGFWTIAATKGRLPDALKGNYTSVNFATIAIQAHYRK